MDERTLKRLFSKINKNGPVPTYRPELGPCWIWRGKPGSRGYGYFWYDQKKRLAHRFCYEVFVGPIPEGLVIDHLCRRPICVRGSHLEPVTDRINILRGEGHAARNVLKDSCGQGHPLDEENTYWYPDGRERGCKTCRAAAVDAWRRRNRWQGGKPVAERTHCPQGHAYDNANTYVSPEGKRVCRTCKRISDRETKRRQRARRKADSGETA